MRARRTVMILAVVGMVMGVMAPVSAGGHTADQLLNAGFECGPAGPNDWIHCNKAKPSAKVINNFVFSTDGQDFLGTEALLHDDIYNGQPCPQEGADEWTDLSPFPYWACHHFATS